MSKVKIYDTADNDYIEQMLKDGYSESWAKKCLSVMGKPVGTKAAVPVACMDGDVCPDCGSIEYYRSGSCKTCRVCGFAGGCG